MRSLAIGVWMLAGCAPNASGGGSAADTTPGDGPMGTSTTSTTIPLPMTSGTDDGTTVGIDSTTTGPMTSGSSTTGESSSESTGSVLECGVAPSPPVDCARECDDCDEDQFCRLNCNGELECEQDTITCPPDEPCRVRCSGIQACTQATIVCPANHACEVECFGDQSCNQVVLVCGSGPCTLRCNTPDTSCTQVDFRCGPNESLVHCISGQVDPPMIDAGNQDRCECGFDGGSC